MSVPGRRAARLVVMAWDGMRSDLMNRELTPNLARLADSGVIFDNSHAVVPTVTRCNAATLASGAVPAVHGLPANLLFAPCVDPTNLISFGEGDSYQQLRAAYGVFEAPTIADVIGAAGGRTAVVSSGTRGCAQMLNPRRRERGELILHPTLSTEAQLAPIVARLGPLPEADVPDTARNRWLARAAAEIVIPEQRPDLLLFWHDDPDKTQHRFGFGHPLALDAIRAADRHLGILLDGLDAAGLRDETVVVVVSDHGYVNVRSRVDLAAQIGRLEAGNQLVVAPNGCAALVFANGASERDLSAFVHRAQALPEVGVIFSGGRGGPVLDGTVDLKSVGGGGPLAPDLLVTAAWSDELSEHSRPGLSFEFNAPIAGSHGGASAWEVRNTMVMAGPGMRGGVTSALPSGSIDLAPTLLAVLGLSPVSTMRGRVLTEALTDPRANDVLSGATTPADPTPTTEHIRSITGTAWLRWSETAGQRYLDAAWFERENF